MFTSALESRYCRYRHRKYRRSIQFKALHHTGGDHSTPACVTRANILFCISQFVFGPGDIQPSEYVGIGELTFDLAFSHLGVADGNLNHVRRCARVSPVQYYHVCMSEKGFRFRYTSALQSAFSSGGISSLQDLDNRGEIFFIQLECILNSWGKVGLMEQNPMFSSLATIPSE